MNAQEKAQSIIDNLLQQADNDPDFKAWQEAHPERHAEIEAMSKEEVIQEILSSLEKLGLIAPETQPEPQKDDAAEAMPDFDSLTPEQQEAAELMLAGFDKALEEIAEGDYSEAADLITGAYRAERASRLHFMAMGYAAGVCHGMRAGSCSTDAEEA